ncbi:alcohol dehydrogenase -like domain-containing protein [Pleurostoma richardsiae]|uniref:Alcohol dehydrogenase -like domain-containing protein n=1 Tax=Pleurostoma richardsiae TaxID=41990 RepID=A0AA38RMR8_9PEZI|nr:alcohol dehydrogenase -like domain-containing protein [Pleurostoma richardsiae]
MRGVVWQGNPYQMAVVDLPRPTLQVGTDVIVRVTTSAICGTDLHVYHGVYGSATAPWGMGHEAVGIIDEIGNNVLGFSVGDHVIIPDSVGSGAVDLAESQSFAFGLGDDYGEGMGGTQAEYVRVPFATQSLIHIPTTNSSGSANGTAPSDSEYLFVADIFGTAWTGLTWSGFESGDTVAIFGAGPVGLLAAYSAVLRGASRVYSVDHVPERLERATSIGAIPINFVDVDPVQAILSHEASGVTRVVDCVGFEAVNRTLQREENIVLRNAVAVLAVHGGIGNIGIYNTQRNSSGAPLGAEFPQQIDFPAADFFSKGLTWRAGPVPVLDVATELVQLIASGKARPSFIVSSEIGIEQAPEYYERFDRHEEVKVLINFSQS